MDRTAAPDPTQDADVAAEIAAWGDSAAESYVEGNVVHFAVCATARGLDGVCTCGAEALTQAAQLTVEREQLLRRRGSRD